MNQTVKPINKKEVRIYACGGAGINIASKIEAHGKVELFAPCSICYIDTSHSNLIGRNVDDNNSYLFNGLDGSGKVRAENAEIISKNVLAVLQKFPAEELNIVIHSASGGSGSVLAPSIVSELKAKGKNVIVLMVGSTDSIIETENVFKTFETYDAISNLRESSTVLQYLNNDKGGRTNSDKEVIYSVTALLALYGGHHAELDSADLNSWLKYATYSVDKPTIATLDILTNPNDIVKLDKIVSVATLATPAMVTRIDVPIQYQCIGFVPTTMVAGHEGSINIIDKEPMNFIISFDALKGIYKELKDLVASNKEALKALTKTNSNFEASSKIQDNGLVL